MNPAPPRPVVSKFIAIGVLSISAMLTTSTAVLSAADEHINARLSDKYGIPSAAISLEIAPGSMVRDLALQLNKVSFECRDEFETRDQFERRLTKIAQQSIAHAHGTRHHFVVIQQAASRYDIDNGILSVHLPSELFEAVLTSNNVTEVGQTGLGVTAAYENSNTTRAVIRPSVGTFPDSYLKPGAGRSVEIAIAEPETARKAKASLRWALVLRVPLAEFAADMRLCQQRVFLTSLSKDIVTARATLSSPTQVTESEFVVHALPVEAILFEYGTNEIKKRIELVTPADFRTVETINDWKTASEIAQRRWLGQFAHEFSPQWNFAQLERQAERFSSSSKLRPEGPAITLIELLRAIAKEEKEKPALTQQADTMPIPTKQAGARYPWVLRKAGITGEVLVAFTITEKGLVEDAAVESSSHPEFDKAAIEAVKKWEFKPATKDGVPVRIRMQTPLVFTLEG